MRPGIRLLFRIAANRYRRREQDISLDSRRVTDGDLVGTAALWDQSAAVNSAFSGPCSLVGRNLFLRIYPIRIDGIDFVLLSSSFPASLFVSFGTVSCAIPSEAQGTPDSWMPAGQRDPQQGSTRARPNTCSTLPESRISVRVLSPHQIGELVTSKSSRSVRMIRLLCLRSVAAEWSETRPVPRLTTAKPNCGTDLLPLAADVKPDSSRHAPSTGVRRQRPLSVIARRDSATTDAATRGNALNRP